MSNCTCTTDKQMTCIVHPTPVSLKERIAELEAEAENAKTYMVNLSKTVEALRECAEAFNAAAEGHGINFYEYGKDAAALLKEGGDE